MFSTLSDHVPKFETRKALIVINLQNDSFERKAGVVICNPSDFVERIKAMIPAFRRAGEIIWVKTEFEERKTTRPLSQGSWTSKDEVDVEEATDALTLKDAPENSAEDEEQEAQSQSSDEYRTVYFPTSRTKAVMRHASEEVRNEQRDEQHRLAFDEDDDLDEYLKKPRKGQAPRFFYPGSHGAAIMDDVKPYVNEATDMMVVKHHYSALDATPLLLSLRMKLVTHVYLCGLISNVSIYATAADAVRHGFEVTVVEDCMGYRSEQKHVDCMRHMADLLGVSGIDSEEIIDDIGGNEPPDSEVPIFSGPGIEGIQMMPTSRQRYDPRQHESRNINHSMSNLEIERSETQSTEEELEKPGSVARRSSGTPRPPPEHDNLVPSSRELQKERQLKSTLGPGDRIGEGDSSIIYEALSPSLGAQAFRLVKEEVNWQPMRHRSGDVPRRVAVQGEIGEDGSKPVYRHPADESPPLSPFTATVAKIRDELQKRLRQPFNHALIQLYRDGQDNISEHSDKTLDIVPNSNIVNVSLGAQRVMTMRTKRSGSQDAARHSQRIPLPHNSLFVLGTQTNRRWLHGIRADKRRPAEKTAPETAFGGERISLTFRLIGTFTDGSARTIWGQGAPAKTAATATAVTVLTPGRSGETEAMIAAFGHENQQADFDWAAAYGRGFSVVNLVPPTPQLFLCADPIANLRVLLSVFERNMPVHVSRDAAPPPPPPSSPYASGPPPTYLQPAILFPLTGTENPTFRDTDPAGTTLVGDLAILFHLGRAYPLYPALAADAAHQGLVFARVTQVNDLLALWRRLRPRPGAAAAPDLPTAFAHELEIWDEYAEAAEFVGGPHYALVDCALWPVVDAVVREWEGWDAERWPDLAAWWRRVGGMESVRKGVAVVERGGG